MKTKTFEDLIHEVHEKGICQECGGCVSFCSSVDYNVIGFKGKYAPPVYINKDKCLECGICYYICPQTRIQDEDLKNTYHFENFASKPMGSYQEIHSCRATDKKFLEHGTDGGVVNSILNYLIEKKLIDGAIVSKVQAPFSRDAIFAESKDDLIKASGTKLDITSQLGEIQKFCTYTRSIPKLNHYKFKKLAVVGTPCQIYTIRLMQSLGVEPSQNIDICLGLFCYENFLFDKKKVEKFEKDFNIQFADIKKINIKEDLILKVRDDDAGDRTIHIPFNHLGDYMRPACNACDDFSNVYSDISFGGLGSPDKYTTVITRTEKGKGLLRKILDDGIIECLELNSERKSKIKEQIIQLSQKKVQRREKFMKNLE